MPSRTPASSSGGAGGPRGARGGRGTRAARGGCGIRRALIALALCLPLLGACQTDLALADLKTRWAAPPSRFLPMDGMEVHWRDEGPTQVPTPATAPAPVPATAATTATTAPPQTAGTIDPSPPALLLLHGAGASLHTWEGWIPALRADHRVVRLDLPGFGLTGPHPSGDYSGTATVDFLERFVAAAGLERFVLVGHSLGGYYAWRYALRHPQQVTQLVLIDAVAYPVEMPRSASVLRWLATLPGLRTLLAQFPVDSLVARGLRDTYGDPSQVTEAQVERYASLMRRPGNRAAVSDRARGESQPTGWEDLSRLPTPTLLMWGEADRWTPLAQAERLRATLPNSRLVSYPGVGHLPMEEAPARTVADLRRFLAGEPIAGQK